MLDKQNEPENIIPKNSTNVDGLLANRENFDLENERLQQELFDAERAVQTEQLIERVKVANTPFTIVGNREKGYMLTLGVYKLTDYVETMEEVRELLVKDQWNITIRLVATLHEAILNEISKAGN
ncbi:hypothetical protein [Flyfo microvirus Tbat2_116]|nr:hypothetical protein [Flyfo microvirus Tbat2_116]